MRPFSMDPSAPIQATSTGTANVQTITLPKGTSAILIAAETTAARIVLDTATAPTATVGILIQPALQPVLIPVGDCQAVKFVSNAAANSIVTVIPLS